MGMGLRGETSIAASTNLASESTEQKAEQAKPILQDKLLWLCGRKIGVDLSDNSKWLDYTPSYFNKKEPESREMQLC